MCVYYCVYYIVLVYFNGCVLSALERNTPFITEIPSCQVWLIYDYYMCTLHLPSYLIDIHNVLLSNDDLNILINLLRNVPFSY